MKNDNHKIIAIVINTSWNIVNFRLGLIKALQNEGYKIIAIAPRDEYSQKLEAMDIEFHHIDINNKGTNPIEDAKLVFAFYKLYKMIAPDVLLQYTIKPNIYGSMAAGMLRIPVISNISGLGTVFLNDHFSSKIARILYKIALRVPQKVFYQNTHDRELFVASRLINKEKTDLLPGSGIDTEKFKPSADAKKESQQPLRFLFIARLVKDKGLIEYVEAARQLVHTTQPGKGLEFSILGSYYPGNPTAISEYEMKAWEEEGIVNYLGVSDDVRSLLTESDCIVLPSYREGLSRVLLEAASMEKPIITTNVPGCKEVVEDGVTGYLCNVKDTDSLVEQMQKMISLTDAERLEMGRKGRAKVLREFNENIVIEKYRKAIEEVLKKNAL